MQIEPLSISPKAPVAIVIQYCPQFLIAVEGNKIVHGSMIGCLVDPQGNSLRSQGVATVCRPGWGRNDGKYFGSMTSRGWQVFGTISFAIHDLMMARVRCRIFVVASIGRSTVSLSTIFVPRALVRKTTSTAGWR